MIYYRTVTKEKIFCQHAAVAQSVERRIGSAEVTGPIPVSSSWKPDKYWLCGYCIITWYHLGYQTYVWMCLILFVCIFYYNFVYSPISS